MLEGITETEHKMIKDILKEYCENFEFYYYGSRVKGDFEKTSDLDILIKNKLNNKVPFEILEDLRYKFDKSLLPYIVNICDYYEIDKDFYIKNIQRDLIVIF